MVLFSVSMLRFYEISLCVALGLFVYMQVLVTLVFEWFLATFSPNLQTKKILMTVSSCFTDHMNMRLDTKNIFCELFQCLKTRLTIEFIVYSLVLSQFHYLTKNLLTSSILSSPKL